MYIFISTTPPISYVPTSRTPITDLQASFRTAPTRTSNSNTVHQQMWHTMPRPPLPQSHRRKCRLCTNWPTCQLTNWPPQQLAFSTTTESFAPTNALAALLITTASPISSSPPIASFTHLTQYNHN